jgi:hypothetical protein
VVARFFLQSSSLLRRRHQTEARCTGDSNALPLAAMRQAGRLKATVQLNFNAPQRSRLQCSWALAGGARLDWGGQGMRHAWPVHPDGISFFERAAEKTKKNYLVPTCLWRRVSDANRDISTAIHRDIPSISISCMRHGEPASTLFRPCPHTEISGICPSLLFPLLAFVVIGFHPPVGLRIWGLLQSDDTHTLHAIAQEQCLK